MNAEQIDKDLLRKLEALTDSYNERGMLKQGHFEAFIKKVHKRQQRFLFSIIFLVGMGAFSIFLPYQPIFKNIPNSLAIYRIIGSLSVVYLVVFFTITYKRRKSVLDKLQNMLCSNE